MQNLRDTKIYIELTKNKKIEISELLYLIAFSIFILYSTIRTTMLRNFVPNGIATFVNLICIVLIVYKVLFFDKYSFKKLILISVIFSMLIISSIISKYSELIYLALLIIGANNVSFKRIVKTYFFITLSITIFAIIASKIGIIENLIYYRNGKVRYSFGSIYCTDFAARIFYLILAYVYLKGVTIKKIDIIVFIILGCFVSYFCGARLDSISIFVMCIFLIYIKIKNRYVKDYEINISKLIKLVLTISVPICAIVSIYVTYIYKSSDKFLNQLNQLLSYRLAYGKRGIIEYGFNLFGQQVKLIGSGGTDKIVSNYFFIDCSYLYIALKYGLIILLIFCIFFTALNRKMLKNGEIVIPILIMLIAINSMVAHHFTGIVYNVFILCFFANIDIDFRKDNEILLLNRRNKNV